MPIDNKFLNITSLDNLGRNEYIGTIECHFSKNPRPPYRIIQVCKVYSFV